MGAPDEFHPDVHPDAKEITGEREYGKWGQCVATAKSSGDRCRGYAKGPHGKCYNHGGATPTKDENPNVGKGSENQEGNGRAAKHNMLSDASLLYDRLDDDQQDLVDGWKRTFMQDIADSQGYAGADAVPSYFNPVVHRLAMNMLRMTVFAEDWEGASGVKDDVSNPLVNRTVVDRTESGEPLYQYSESVVENAAARMSRENRQWLKDLGIIDSPASDLAKETGSLATAIREEMTNQPSDD